MTIIVFLIDTSASMNQRAFMGGRPTLLDVAKGAVEMFVKFRQRIPESKGDRYMLLTLEDPPNNIKAGWKENLATFMSELKNLECTGLTSMGSALKHTFDILNLNRMQTGIDTYGQGRCPFYLEPSVIIVITDGARFSSPSGVHDDIVLPMTSPIPGSELTREPFRWDQRLFSLVLRLAGTPPIERDGGLVPSDTSPIDAMCEVTGGRSYCVTSQRVMIQCLESLVQKVHAGVVIHFEKIGPDPPPIEGRDDNDQGDVEKIDDEIKPGNLSAGWQNCRKLIYVPRSATKGFAVGHWPIPENFWPDLSASSIPPRSAHPNVKFTCAPQEVMALESVPFDKYEMEPSPLTQFILARRQPNVCWQVFLSNSYKNSETSHPFGYLKASTYLTRVNLYVMPYNYPVLLQLLDELFKTLRMKPTNEWRLQFANYLKMMPAYYASPLRRALTRMGAPSSLASNLVPETLDASLSIGALQYLRKIKVQAKEEFERLCDEVSNRQSNKVLSEGVRVIPRSPLKKNLVSHPLLQDEFSGLKEQLNDFGGFVVGITKEGSAKVGAGSFRNPFDIPRRNLVEHLVKLRANFLRPSLSRVCLQDEDFRHSMPLSQMGNYQEHLNQLPPPLKEIETAPVRQHMFGNPFKIDKKMMVDEADLDVVGLGGSRGTKRSLSDSSNVSRSPSTNRRKPGPLPRDFTAKRRASTTSVPSSPEPTPPPSPSPCSSPPPPPESPPPLIVPALVNTPPSLPLPLATPPSLPLMELPLLPQCNGTSSLEEPRSRSPSPPILTNEILEPFEPMELDQLLPPTITPAAPPPTPSMPPPLPPPDPEIIRQHNLTIKRLAFKYVRRPGRDYSDLLKCVKDVKGEMQDQKSILREIVNECLRFKRQRLATILQQLIP